MDVEPVLGVNAVEFVGYGLHRPECVLCTPDGVVHVSNWRGGITRLQPDGSQTTVLAENERWLRPNGFAIDHDGSYLIAHLGDDAGGVYRLRLDGSLDVVLDEIDGVPLPPTNFVHRGRDGRLWITVSTRHSPRALAYRADVADGFIVELRTEGPRIVADGLGYTNEARVDPAGRHLYVNETFGRRLSRFEITATGLGRRTTVAEFGVGTYPDGLAFDELGGVWITSIISNRVLRIAADGDVSCVLADADPIHVESVERMFAAGRLDAAHLNAVAGDVLTNVSSIAFGGPDRRTIHLGCIGGDRVATLRTSYVGAETW